ncbi:NAD(P)-dependent oxidoreductase [Pseudactinotalea sp. HY158]|uniref:NAD-dependent epimerase/dehydratase family protein n=1 Tax=Pseudactinotalea sp. HY158 TaxID=2654547 RepID=UPI00129CAD77|nr:NAD-dependent epimerase/dehydratase family protein [Pseudactinotalea sp. HY158]QGH68833.1 NAD-dependent epimerase/dehydratase family protein [Pseudactinotalea sp. HY158]
MPVLSGPVLTGGERIVVLGGSGFIGSHIIPALIGAGFDVVNYDLYPPQRPLPDAVVDLRGDIRDEATLTSALTGARAVLNLAAAHHDFGLTEATFTSVNVDGAGAVTRAMTAAGVDNLCFYSSVAVYGEQPSTPTEETAPAPTNAYGRTKLAAEAVYRDWQRSGERRVLIVRPAVVFGPGNTANMYRMIDQIARRRFVSVGPGANRKSMVYVENIVAAILHFWSAEPRVDPEVYNCVDAPDLTSRAIITRVYRALGRRVPRLRLPLAPAIACARPLDWIAARTGRNLPITSDRIAKVAGTETRFSGDRMREHGYSQPRPIAAGIDEMVAWYVETGKNVRIREHLPPERPVLAREGVGA